MYSDHTRLRTTYLSKLEKKKASTPAGQECVYLLLSIVEQGVFDFPQSRRPQIIPAEGLHLINKILFEYDELTTDELHCKLADVGFRAYRSTG